jgi:hypothetical protein
LIEFFDNQILNFICYSIAKGIFMGDPTISFRFDTEDKVNRFRKAADSNNDGVVKENEVSSDATQAQPARNALNRVTLPGTTGATGVTVDGNTTAADVSSGLGQGTGVVSNRSLFSIPNGPNHVQSSEMNIGDASNYTRLRAAGLTEGQLNSSKNIFMHLGQDSSGKEQYGFYSKGFGEGDERTGVVTVGKDGKISSSLGAGWSPATKDQQQVLNDAYEAREQLIKDKFSSKFENYSKFEKARSQVDDLLARSDIQGNARKDLVALKKKMDPSDSVFDHNSVTREATALLNNYSNKLTDIQKKEAEGKVDNPNDSDTEATLDTKLKNQTNKVNALDANGKTEFNTEYEKLQDKLKNLGSSNDEKVQAFKKASDYLKSVKEPDKTSLAEVKWQNARFERMMNDPKFESEVKKNKTPSQTPPTPSSPSAPSEPSTPSSPSATQYQPGATLNQEQFLNHIGIKSSGSVNFQNDLQALVDSGNGISAYNVHDENLVLVDTGVEKFVYDTQAQTATKLQAVEGSDELFYSPKEPGSVLLKSATGVELKKLDWNNNVDFYHNSNNYIYDSATSKWIIKAL